MSQTTHMNWSFITSVKKGKFGADGSVFALLIFVFCQISVPLVYRWFIPLFLGSQPSVMQDFLTIHSISPVEAGMHLHHDHFGSIKCLACPTGFFLPVAWRSMGARREVIRGDSRWLDLSKVRGLAIKNSGLCIKHVGLYIKNCCLRDILMQALW